MIVLRTPKGWTGPREVDGLPVEGTWRSHQVPMTDVRGEPRAPPVARGVAQSYRPEELFDEAGRLVPELAELRRRRRAPDERQPARERRRAAPRPRPPGLPRLRRRGAEARNDAQRADARAGRLPRDVVARNSKNFLLFGPDETASNRLGDVFEVTGRRWLAAAEPTDEDLAADGRVLEVLSGAPLPRLARGLSPDRPARALQLLRGVHPHRRLDVQPAREVAEGDAPDPVAAADRLAQLPPQLARVAAGPQRLLAPGPRVHRPRREQEGGGHPRLPAAGREHAALGGRPLPAQPSLRERDRRRQAAGA